MTITIGDVLEFLNGLLPTILSFAAIAVLFKGWIKRVATSSEQTAAQVKTSNGRTLAEYTESMARDVGNLNEHMSELTEKVGENSERSIRAESLAMHAHERLDKHMVNDHGFHLSPTNNNEE